MPIKKYYPKITKLLNYKFFNIYTANTNTTSFKNIKLEKKIKYVLNILHRFGITHLEQFNFSIDCGIGKEGRTKNKKENPNIISSNQYNGIREALMSVVKNNEFRFVFGLEKVNEDINNRQILETVKKVIGEFGFVITVVEKISTIYEQNIKKSIQINTYFIDLDNTIIELLNLTSRDYFDEIIDGVSTYFNEDEYDDEIDDDEIDDENSDNEFELDY